MKHLLLAQANAIKIQKRLLKPRSSVQQAADVVEHALQTGGEDYLDTQEHLYKWWQLAMLDVQAALLLAVTATLSIFCGTLLLIARSAARLLRPRKHKAQ